MPHLQPPVVSTAMVLPKSLSDSRRISSSADPRNQASDRLIHDGRRSLRAINHAGLSLIAEHFFHRLSDRSERSARRMRHAVVTDRHCKARIGIRPCYRATRSRMADGPRVAPHQLTGIFGRRFRPPAKTRPSPLWRDSPTRDQACRYRRAVR